MSEAGMKIAVACDHRGFEAKRRLLPVLRQWGHCVRDFGCDSAESCDYPDFALPASRAVAEGECAAGILFDGSGIGMCVAANKVCTIRAALVYDELTARRAREHNHCNVLCLGADLLSEPQIRRIAEIFLQTPFGNARHVRRVGKICAIEKQMQSFPLRAPSEDPQRPAPEPRP